VTAIERLRTTLAAMNLTAIDARLEALLESASKKEPSYADFLLEVMSADGPLALFIEDLHWSDHATLAWLAYVARRPDPAPA